MSEEWAPGVIYLRHVDKKGNSYVEEHRCWNAPRFLEAAHDRAMKEGGSVSLVSEDAYRSAKDKDK